MKKNLIKSKVPTPILIHYQDNCIFCLLGNKIKQKANDFRANLDRQYENGNTLPATSNYFQIPLRHREKINAPTYAFKKEK